MTACGSGANPSGAKGARFSPHGKNLTIVNVADWLRAARIGDDGALAGAKNTIALTIISVADNPSR
jgi:hypothetical protein